MLYIAFSVILQTFLIRVFVAISTIVFQRKMIMNGIEKDYKPEKQPYNESICFRMSRSGNLVRYQLWIRRLYIQYWRSKQFVIKLQLPSFPIHYKSQLDPFYWFNCFSVKTVYENFIVPISVRKTCYNFCQLYNERIEIRSWLPIFHLVQ